jgi:hypothetical protein
MKLQGVPNELISMDIELSIKCDDKGIIDLDETTDKILNKILIPRLSRYPKQKEESEEDKQAEEARVYKCKVEGCNAEFTNKGLFLAHCREHKKEERESEV